MRYLVLAAALAASACNNRPPSPPATDTNAAAQVTALSEGQRRAVLLRAIRDAGLDCQGVTGAVPIAAAGTAPRWRARCTNGSEHLIAIDPDGTARIVSQAGA